MKISEAFSELSAGKLMTRAAWEKDEFVYLVPGSTFTVNRKPLTDILGEGTLVTYRPHTDRRYADGTCGYWIPTKDDAEADDWVIFTPPTAEPVMEPVVSASVAPAPEPVAPVETSVATGATEAPTPAPVSALVSIASVAPEPAPAPAEHKVTAVWYIEERPVAEVFVPKFWNAQTGKFVQDPNAATPYDTMSQAIQIAQGLIRPARVIRYARQS